jgi:hypothetical protein
VSLWWNLSESRMREIRMSGSMSGEGKPPAASRSRSSALPRLYGPRPLGFVGSGQVLDLTRLNTVIPLVADIASGLAALREEGPVARSAGKG